jgi:hypothetical protein
MTGMVLYGLDGSTYVRTVRMLLAEKGAHYEQVPVNVLKGERPSLGVFYVAPICFLASLTPDASDVFADGFARRWEQIQVMPSYQATAPQFSRDL